MSATPDDGGHSLPSPTTSPPQTADTEPNDQQVTLVGRAIYYVLGVSSLICLSNSIGDVWPSKREDGTLIEIPNSKYAAVVLASLYAIALARTLFFDRPPRCDKIGPYVEVFYSLCLFITAFVIAFTYRSDPDVRFFAMSAITCAIAIFQLTHPLEEFYVGKTLFVIVWTAFVTECFNGGSKDVVMGFIGGFCLVSIGIASHLSINDLTQRLTQV
ncbi:unnamed protein product [Brassica rapa]|uniref:Uncharacterized protein n=1 Tax=Brassica campestris TaxID=3711 RepID=A0A3P5ZBX1_BRACM|nr:unnamed protein product [Brassica rapa]VDC73164.1 unnamed protein product [Brassica rapa]